MTIQRLKELIKESVHEVMQESSCPICGESVYENEQSCECMNEDSMDLSVYKDLLKKKLTDLD